MFRRCFAVLLVFIILFSVVPVQAFAASGNTKLIALTFDDGPCKDTERLLKALRDRNVKVTFFMLGTRAYNYPEIVKKAYEDGHQIANHSNGHPMLTKLKDEQIKDQISYAENHLSNAVGGPLNCVFRPPYGDVNQRVLDLVGVPAILWSVDSNDWRWTNDALKTTNQIVSRAFDGAIILVHDIHTWSVTGAISAIDKLKAQGYEFVTVSELFRRRGATLYGYNTYRSCKPTGTQLPAISAPSVSMSVSGNTSYINISADEGTEIRYTLDGSVPNPSSPVYTGPVAFDGSVSVCAVAGYDMNGSRSPLTKAAFTAEPKEAKPVISINNGHVSISGSGKIHVSTDGSDPLSGNTIYSGPFGVGKGTDIKAAVEARSESIHYSDTAALCYSDNGNIFSDVFTADWFYKYMDYAYSENLLSGVSETEMNPEGTLTRGMIAAILYRMAGRPQISAQDAAETVFPDVYAGKYYETAAKWAKINKIASGYQDGTFKPNNPISRQQLAAMLYNYERNWLHQEPSVPENTVIPYNDALKVENYAVNAVRWAVSAGLLSDYKTAVLDPGKPASRAMTAAMLYHFNH